MLLLVAWLGSRVVAPPSNTTPDVPTSTTVDAPENAPEGAPDTTPESAPDTTPDSAPEILTCDIRLVKKYGNVILDTSFDEMDSHGMDVGDIITAVVGGAEYDMPVGTSFTDVDTGNMVCRC